MKKEMTNGGNILYLAKLAKLMDTESVTCNCKVLSKNSQLAGVPVLMAKC